MKAPLSSGSTARVAGPSRRILRVTTTDTLLNGLLTPILAAFRSRYPEIHFEPVVSNARLSLTRREADVAARATQAPPEHLVGRRLGRIAQAVYGAAAIFEGRPLLVDPRLPGTSYKLLSVFLT